MKRYRVIEILRAAWGVALLIAPDRVLRATDSGPVDPPSRTVIRILGARQLTQATLSGLRPSPEVLAMGVWVDTVHALTASALALGDRRRARAGCTDAAIAGVWAGAGYHELRKGRATPRDHQRVRDRLADVVLDHAPGGRRLRGEVNRSRS
ncbi:hypothetical protein H7J51_12285 [Mycobacterium crocinum]|uniref:Uncharacterized protein n=1 Tax=Mycolicibacterium crocinum TaxID=388459 RepID=A0ABY3TMM7_9MYCO|nr:hypothetical protein [Mycolicibacterium crocinum]MCV7216058.1 hypothetical protein [Mycolicibacterium crocinum]ULN40999.1 hypothetical protein MI149_25830 [Mycolicibacterium crocinum]